MKTWSQWIVSGDTSRRVNHSGRHPSKGLVIRTLKDGYWDRTEVIELPEGGRRVRKRTKGAAFGPWGVESLRREIRYLTSLPERTAAVFPPVLAAWDDESGAAPDVGYEMPFYADHIDAGELARGGTLAQDEIDGFQDALADALFDRLHEPLAAQESLAGHVSSVVGQAWRALEKDPALSVLIQATDIELNGGRVLGPRTAFDRIRRRLLQRGDGREHQGHTTPRASTESHGIVQRSAESVLSLATTPAWLSLRANSSSAQPRRPAGYIGAGRRAAFSRARLRRQRAGGHRVEAARRGQMSNDEFRLSNRGKFE